jgi:hypothetical protein
MYVKSDWDHFDGLPAADEEDTYLLIEELARELFDSGGSDYEHPKWTVKSLGKDVVVSFDESQEGVWNVAKSKIEAYRACICRLSKRSFDDIDPVKHILKLFMGKMSSLMNLMMTELNLSYQKVAHFLGTFNVQKS